MIFFPVQVEERAEQTKYHAKMRKARFPLSLAIIR
jgi:hypothetical protein